LSVFLDGGADRGPLAQRVDRLIGGEGDGERQVVVRLLDGHHGALRAQGLVEGVGHVPLQVGPEPPHIAELAFEAELSGFRLDQDEEGAPVDRGVELRGRARRGRVGVRILEILVDMEARAPAKRASGW